MFDYQRSGCSRFGADMGRRSDLPSDTTAALILRRVPIEDGYDPGGAYWGGPNDLFCATDPESGEVSYFRAKGPGVARAKFPRATWIQGPADGDIADMLQAYISAALWSSNDESNDQGGEPLDRNYSSDDLAPESLATMTAEIERFHAANAGDIEGCASQAGHDFWMTRNRHGVGFWDGGWSHDAGARMTEAAHAFGEVNLYVGDDGKIYQS